MAASAVVDEVPIDDRYDAADPTDQVLQVEVRHDVARPLAALSPGQRAAVVLRYFDDLSEADTALALRCSVGAVKSQTARALVRLRADPSIRALLPSQGAPT